MREGTVCGVVAALEQQRHGVVVLVVAGLGERRAEEVQVEHLLLPVRPVEEHGDDPRRRLARRHLEDVEPAHLLGARPDVLQHLADHALDRRLLACQRWTIAILGKARRHVALY